MTQLYINYIMVDLSVYKLLAEGPGVAREQKNWIFFLAYTTPPATP